VIPWRIKFQQDWLGAQVLFGELGIRVTLGLLPELKRRERQGAPWMGLGEPSSEAEKWSREQIGPAIALYQVLRDREVANPLDVIRKVILGSTVPWMKWAIGTISPVHYRAMTPGERLAWIEGKTSGFFNMELTDLAAHEEGASFRVVKCFFPGLCAQAGVPEMAPLFCEVDAMYFGGVQKGIELDRKETLAQGGTHCGFAFRWTGEE
jgi:hypothetical protein